MKDQIFSEVLVIIWAVFCAFEVPPFVLVRVQNIYLF
jgi:hypothetical protein